MEPFLSRSASDSGFQGDDDEVTWQSAAGEAALDDSLSSFNRVTSVEQPKETRKESKARKEALEKELDEESDISLSDDDRQMEASASRKTSLSPAQFLESMALGPLTGSGGMQQRAMERLPAHTVPIQVSETKGMEASVVEAVACEVASGVITTQQDIQGIPQGSPSVSFPTPTSNMPPTEHAQALRRNLAAELTHAGSGRSLLTSPARHSQEPGTAISMSSPIVTRRNNVNSPLQVQDGNRTADEPRDECRQFAEAGGATRSEAQYQQGAQPRIELARGQQRSANEGQGQAATRSGPKFSQSEIEFQDRMNAEHIQRMEAERVKRRRRREVETALQREAEATAETPAERLMETEATANAARTAPSPSSSSEESSPVMDMRFCISNLNAIRAEAGDFTLKDFSDY